MVLPCLRYGISIDNRIILQALETKLSGDEKVPTASEQGKAKLVDMMQSLLSYARVVRTDCAVRYINVGISDIVKDMHFSFFLASKTRLG